MAVTLTDHRAIWSEADSATGWTGATTVYTSDPNPAESTGSLGIQVSTTTADGYYTSSISLTNKLVYVWVQANGTMDTIANGGTGVYVSDGSNSMSYHKSGSDEAGFRHATGPVRWENLILDQASLPSQKTTRGGSEGSLNWGSITRIGATFKTLSKSLGGQPNCFIDIIRTLDLTANNGCALSITGGTSGTPGLFSEIATADRSTANQAAHGLVRELAPGLYGVQGPLRFGNATGTASSWFQDTNVAVAFESRGIRTTVYGIYITDNGTGTTTFRLGTKVGSGSTATGQDGCSLIAPTGVGAYFDSGTDTDVDDVKIYATLISGFTGGVTLGAGQEFIDNTVTGSGAITCSGVSTLVQTSVTASTVAADTSSLIWNNATDPDGYLDGMTFAKGTNAHHAIEFGLSSPTTMTIRNMNFTGFSGSNAANDSVLHIKRTTGTVTVNAIGCSGTVSYKTAGATVVIVADPVTTSVHVQDVNTAAAVTGARVLMYCDSGGGKPGDVTVTITRSGSTATVTHTSHGLSTSDKVLIKGADQAEYNGVKTITNTGTNTYTYTVSGSPTTPATGTIKASLVVIDATVDGSGNASDTRTWPSSQPITGRVRKGSSATFYKSSPLAGTISSTTGLSLTAQMIPDA
jgi:hypothetical protein